MRGAFCPKDLCQIKEKREIEGGGGGAGRAAGAGLEPGRANELKEFLEGHKMSTKATLSLSLRSNAADRQLEGEAEGQAWG